PIHGSSARFGHRVKLSIGTARPSPWSPAGSRAARSSVLPGEPPERLALEAADLPLAQRTGAERAVERLRPPVPVEHRPLEAAASTGDGNPTDLSHDRGADAPSARRAERMVKGIASGSRAAELVEEELDAIVPPEALAVDHEDRHAEDPLLQARLERLRHLVVVAPGGERVEERLA